MPERFTQVYIIQLVYMYPHKNLCIQFWYLGRQVFDNMLPRRKCFVTNYGTVSSSINIGHEQLQNRCQGIRYSREKIKSLKSCQSFGRKTNSYEVTVLLTLQDFYRHRKRELYNILCWHLILSICTCILYILQTYFGVHFI